MISFYVLLLRVCQNLSVFQGEKSTLASSFRLIGSQAIRQQLLKYAKYTDLWVYNCKPCWPPNWEIWRCVPWVTVAKIRASNDCISSFPGSLVDL